MISKKNIYWLLLVLLGFQWSACKKESKSTPSIIGKWQVVTVGTTPDYISYYIFTDSKSGYLLEQDKYSAHTITPVTYQYDGQFLKVDKGGVTLSKTSFNGDTLILENASGLIGSNNDKWVKRSSAPSAEEWAITPTFLEKTPAPAGDNLGWYNNQLVLCDLGSNSKIKFINPATFAITNTIPFPAKQMRGVDGVGANLWTIEDDTRAVSKVNPSTGAILFTSVDATYQINCMASTGTDLYCVGLSNSRIQKYNIATNTFSPEEYTSYDIKDITYKAGYLYVARSDGYIDKCSLAPYKAIKTWKIPNSYLNAITNDGTNFWVRYSSSISNESVLQKITLD